MSLALYLQACASTPEAEKQPSEADTAKAAEVHSDPPDRAPSVASPTPTSSASEEQRTFAEAQAAFDARKAGFLRANSMRSSENAGKVVVTFTVMPTGEVVECRIVSTDFRDPAFNAAVVAEVWRLRFEPREGREFTYPAYPIVFQPRAEQQPAFESASAAPLGTVAPAVNPAAPAPAPPAAAPAIATPAVTAAAPAPAPAPPLDPRSPRTTQEVQQAFGAHMDAFKRIQQRYGSTLRGTIVTAFTIAPGGEVQEARIVSSDFSDAVLNAEILAEVSRVRLGRVAHQPYSYRDYALTFVPAAATP